MPDLIGWLATAILILTLGRQVYDQWRSGSTKGVSPWLFVGEVSASIGFVVYSWLLGSWVFVATNLAVLITAVTGLLVDRRNRQRKSAS